MRSICIVAVTLLLAGCVTEQDRQAQAKAQWAKMESGMDKRCRENYGYKPGTPEYGQCRDRLLAMTIGVMQHDQDVDMQAQAARAQAWQNAAQSVQNIKPFQAPTYQMPVSQPSQSTTCVSRPGLGTGSMASVTTTCN